jgi:hypothetical protein
VQGRRPFQSYVDSRNPAKLLPLGVIRQFDTSTSANYNALHARAEKRFSDRLAFNAAFTYSRANSILYGANEAAGFSAFFPQNPRNRKGDYGRSSIDQRLRFVYSNVYELPWMCRARGFRRLLLDGWSLNSIIVLQSGLPVTLAQTGDSQNTGLTSAPRPHVAAGVGGVAAA